MGTSGVRRQQVRHQACNSDALGDIFYQLHGRLHAKSKGQQDIDVR